MRVLTAAQARIESDSHNCIKEDLMEAIKDAASHGEYEVMYSTILREDIWEHVIYQTMYWLEDLGYKAKIDVVGSDRPHFKLYNFTIKWRKEIEYSCYY